MRHPWIGLMQEARPPSGQRSASEAGRFGWSGGSKGGQFIRLGVSVPPVDEFLAMSARRYSCECSRKEGGKVVSVNACLGFHT